MIEQFNTAIDEYWVNWKALVAKRSHQAFFKDLKPTAIGWKVNDRAEYDELCRTLHDQSDRVIDAWMNGRWIAKFVLREALSRDIQIIKIMQRRPGSDDAVGLDHLDFYSPPIPEVEQILSNEPELNWSPESNDVIQGFGWLSIWFEGGPEAKLKHHTVLDIIAAEMQQINQTYLRD